MTTFNVCQILKVELRLDERSGYLNFKYIHFHSRRVSLVDQGLKKVSGVSLDTADGNSFIITGKVRKFRLGIVRDSLSVAKTMKANRNGTTVQNEEVKQVNGT